MRRLFVMSPVMSSVMSKFLITSALVTLSSSAVWAGPSTPAMATGSPDAGSSVQLPSTAELTADVAPDRSTDRSPDRSTDPTTYDRPMAVAEAADVAPTDSHPMIPLPPAVWAAFVGLAYVARRVTRRHSI